MTSSGTSTPKTSRTTASDEQTDSATLSGENSNDTNDDEKEFIPLGRTLRKASFSKPVVTGISTGSTSTSATKEHSEQGKVKIAVYLKYIQAASVPGFVIFLLATILQQATSILGNVVLKAWGEHNRETGSNSDMGKYLLAYGLSSLSSTLLGAASAILMWVLIGLRSARSLHDGVGFFFFKFILRKLKSISTFLYNRCYNRYFEPL